MIITITDKPRNDCKQGGKAGTDLLPSHFIENSLHIEHPLLRKSAKTILFIFLKFYIWNLVSFSGKGIVHQSDII